MNCQEEEEEEVENNKNEIKKKKVEIIPEDNTAYSTLNYWEERYKKTQESERYDWFKAYPALQNVIKNYLKAKDQILMLGCGDSALSEDLYKDGFKFIKNIDFAPSVIEKMKNQCALTMPELQWEVMDIMDMSPLTNESIDVAIDKGTMDALMCEKGDVWELDDEIANKCNLMCNEVSRILKPKGYFIQITFGQPHFRKKVLCKPEYQWNIDIKTIGIFIFILFLFNKK